MQVVIIIVVIRDAKVPNTQWTDK